MKKTYIAPEAQVYMVNTPLCLSTSEKELKEDDMKDYTINSNKFWGNDGFWGEGEEESED